MDPQSIANEFQRAWDEFGDDVSTEFLISITADRCECAYERVVSALAQVHSPDAEVA